ncbi:MAG TPA: DUF3568 family protein [Opitutaceae bacterium]|nr:DUF3568 family protein [Opitutaceae bacterium]
MKTNMLRLAAFLLIAPLTVVTTGCVATKTAARDTVSWIRGALEVNLDSSVEDAGRAATTAVKNLKFMNVVSRVDVVSGEINAETAQGTDIDILIDKISERITRVSIRVGAFGDEAVSRLILDEMEKNL